jgi:hypothetical protein
MQMAYDRYDTRQGPREDRSRWSEDRYQSRDRMHGDRDDDRGFFERAGEEISSWFGYGDRDEGRERFDRDRDRDYRRGSGWREVSRQDERGWTGDRDREREDRGYRPMTGDYGRSERMSGGGRDNEWFDRDRSRGSQSAWDRDDYRRTSFAGSRDRSQHDDPHYHSWRERQLSELDRDYDEYHRERQQKFESDFGSWREQRQAKRQLLGQVRPQMEVVGNDDEHVGTVDKVAGDRIILTRSDPQADGVHHSISCADVGRIEGDRVILDCSAEQARNRWRDEDRGRALFEREGSGEMGAHMLDRSFSGTYR